jgi:KDO2-lipid IV(A) lauroyltransferase
MGRKRRSALENRLRLGSLALALRVLSTFFGAFSWRACQWLGRKLGTLGWWLSRRDRRRTLDHLDAAFPELAAAERRRLGRLCFRHLGATLAECLHLLRHDAATVARWVAVEGWEHVEAARTAGRPILVLTGHCGNWELLAATINSRGLGMAVVARSLDEPALQRLLAGLRQRFGTPTIERGSDGAARALLTQLRRGGAIGMLIDQDTKVDGVWVPFFGQPAFTPVGAAKIALRQETVTIPTFIERLADGRHLARFLPPLELPDDLTQATARMTAAIEAQIRHRPEQWVWMHRRWRRKPPPA